jgi:hypothetical protein
MEVIDRDQFAFLQGRFLVMVPDEDLAATKSSSCNGFDM